jgi:coenzyme F420-reducing hydrogenase alpha subunit
MRTLIFAFCILLLAIELAFPVGAVTNPPVDEVELMLAKIQKNLAMASEVTQMAQTKSAALVAQKVVEKKELKEAVVVAEAKVEEVKEVMQKMEDKVEFYTVKMIGSGVDTSFQEVSFSGPVYDAYLNYVEEGGKEDFNYFRLYLWQQK